MFLHILNKVQFLKQEMMIRLFLSFVPIKLVIKELNGSRDLVGENGSSSGGLMVISSSSIEQGSENLKWDFLVLSLREELLLWPTPP